VPSLEEIEIRPPKIEQIVEIDSYPLAPNVIYVKVPPQENYAKTYGQGVKVSRKRVFI
jgi:hypothetical protein